jgi:cytochrome o ubiquinol oxidase operon protein cyoD
VGLTVFFIIAFGTVQMVVHMIYFLHLNTKSEGGWVLMSLAFTVMLVIIAIAGSIWIMFHLDSNMMPMYMDSTNALP